MDALDIGVLRGLFQNEGLTPVSPRARTSTAVLAKKLGVSEGTVRNRMTRFYQTGFVKEVRLIANPTLVGQREACLLFDVPRDMRSEVVEKIELLENVVILAIFHGSLLSPVFRYRTEAALFRQIELFRKIANGVDITVGRIAFPPCHLRLSDSDWALMRAFHRNPRRSYASASRDLGLSTKTVKRKLTRLMRENAAFSFPIFDPARLDGGVMGSLFVETILEMKAEVDRKVMERCGESVFTVFHMVPYSEGDLAPSAYNCLVPNLPRGADMLRDVEALPGVKNARFEVFDEVRVCLSPFEEDLARDDEPSPMAASL